MRFDADYEELKKKRSQLDFEDLIARTAELLIRCGQPMLKEDLTRYEENGFGARMTVKYAERWTYNFGRSEFMQFVTVENGVITEIEDGPRGG